MNFIKYYWLYFAISALIIVPGIISLIGYGVRPSIDFTGGSLLELKFEQPVDLATLESTAKNLYNLESVQSSGENQVLLKGETIDVDKKNQVLTEAEKLAGTPQVLRFEAIGPSLSKELLQKTYVAVAVVVVVITLFISRQFKEWKFGICAVLAMLHDTLVLLGTFSLLGYFYGVEVDVLFVTAVLTTLSFSVHDTIVVYHRIRELQNKHRSSSMEELLNLAVMGTITRSLNNSLTIILMLTALVLLGGESIKWFAVALLIGALTGTYSSTCTAVPLLYVWEKWLKHSKFLGAK
jgi:preprotein translocase subunit SecF